MPHFDDQDRAYFALLRKYIDAATAHAWQQQAEQTLQQLNHGDASTWMQALQSLTTSDDTKLLLDQDVVSCIPTGEMSRDRSQQIESALLSLRPWRKGPWQMASTFVDSEWRSDLKYQRIAPLLTKLEHQSVLDVGCGNGYFALRLLGQGAKWVLGVDPTLLYRAQFMAFRRLACGNTESLAANVLPLRLEALAEVKPIFDLILSMGVIYHQRDAFMHLQQLQRWLKPDGQLILETLIVEGDEPLYPSGRYARMRNVYQIPSVSSLVDQLATLKFSNIQCVDVSTTTNREQRTTAWMPFESLAAALHPTDPTRTIEGYPAPRRALLHARA